MRLGDESAKAGVDGVLDGAVGGEIGSWYVLLDSLHAVNVASTASAKSGSGLAVGTHPLDMLIGSCPVFVTTVSGFNWRCCSVGLVADKITKTRTALEIRYHRLVACGVVIVAKSVENIAEAAAVSGGQEELAVPLVEFAFR